MDKRLRWKQVPRPTGLASVGAGPYRSSNYHDGETEYATVAPRGGNWSRTFEGWYFYARVGDEFINTIAADWPLYATDKEAKRAAEKWVKERLR